MGGGSQPPCRNSGDDNAIVASPTHDIKRSNSDSEVILVILCAVRATGIASEMVAQPSSRP
jgi:hypothetical protein